MIGAIKELQVALDGPSTSGLGAIFSDNERLGKELPSLHPDPLHGSLKAVARIACQQMARSGPREVGR